MSKCVILLSGGQDSATCLAWACFQQRFDAVYPISFNYGQKHKIELLVAEQLVSAMRERWDYLYPIKRINIPDLFQTITHSALFAESEQDVSQEHTISKGLPASFVPGRNYLFLGIAAIFAHSLGIHDIVTGVCQTDYSGYSDCRDNTIKSIELSLSLALDFSFNIHTPLMYKTKAETVKMMESWQALHFYGYTHTCYTPKQTQSVWPYDVITIYPCKECPACKLRAKGFAEAGVIDPLVCHKMEGDKLI